MPKYRCKYEFCAPFGSDRHVWTCIGRHGAVHLHITDLGEDREIKTGIDRYSAGIEIHYRQPPEYMEEDAPSHDRCWLLESPCWHDGSSLQASEHWVPLWLASPHDHHRMFHALCREYEERFGGLGRPTVPELLHEATKDEENP